MAKESNEKAVTPSTPTEAERKEAEKLTRKIFKHHDTHLDMSGDCSHCIASVNLISQALSAARQAGYEEGVEASARMAETFPPRSGMLSYLRGYSEGRNQASKEIRALLTRKEKA